MSSPASRSFSTPERSRDATQCRRASFIVDLMSKDVVRVARSRYAPATPPSRPLKKRGKGVSMGAAATLQELDQRIAAIRNNIGELTEQAAALSGAGMTIVRQNASPNKNGCSPRSSKNGSRSQDRPRLREATSVPDEGRHSVTVSAQPDYPRPSDRRCRRF
jgi:hypothetical protein